MYQKGFFGITLAKMKKKTFCQKAILFFGLLIESFSFIALHWLVDMLETWGYCYNS